MTLRQPSDHSPDGMATILNEVERLRQRKTEPWSADLVSFLNQVSEVICLYLETAIYPAAFG